MAKAVGLEEWQGHLETARSNGVTIADYARQHGLSLSAMYSARYALRQREVGKSRQRRRTAAVGFVPAMVPGLCERLTAQLPNGVTVSLEGGDAQSLHEWLSALAGLRCGV